MTHLITFTDANMTISATHCVQSGIKHGCTQAVIYTPDMVAYDFKRMNAEVFSQPRGAGYWLWKPWIIYDAMLSMSDGDILIYSDAGCQFIDNVNHIISRMGDKPFFFFTNGWKNNHWTKGDILYYMLDSDSIWVNDDQIQASLLFFRVCKESKQFVKEWLLWCQMPGFIDDSPSGWPNEPEFQENRHDQSVLTCMAIRWKIDFNNLWPDVLWINQRHRWPHCDYPPIVLHHRKRNNEWK